MICNKVLLTGTGFLPGCFGPNDCPHLGFVCAAGVPTWALCLHVWHILCTKTTKVSYLTLVQAAERLQYSTTDSCTCPGECLGSRVWGCGGCTIQGVEGVELQNAGPLTKTWRDLPTARRSAGLGLYARFWLRGTELHTVSLWLCSNKTK